MKTIVEGSILVDLDMRNWVSDGHLNFPCGCRFPIDPTKPQVNGLPSLIYNPKEIPLTCPESWKTIGSGMCKGIFQLESRFARPWARRLQPENIEHLAALLSILRPGALQSKSEQGVSMTELFCRRRHGEEPVTIEHEALREILEPTFGVMIYQEQIMKISQVLADFTLVEVDALRSSVGKKDQAKLAKVGKLFIEKCKEKGIVTENQATALFENIKKSGRYCFNKCISSDTVLKRPGGGNQTAFTVEEMFRIRNDITYAKATGHLDLYKKWKRLKSYGYGLSLQDDGRIRPNIIRDIQPAGNRPIFKITVEGNFSIRVTDNHKFPLHNGHETIASSLQVGDLLIYCGPYEKQNATEANKFSDYTNENRWSADPTRGGWSYTNKSFSKFNAFKRTTPNICAVCGLSGEEVRIETHHIDGDRSNSDSSNLEKLCVSHHKKKEYERGRTRKNQKGYPTEARRITSIEPDGECMTYDVTMDGPNHTFVTSENIVTCNSHAVAYSFLTYRSAFEKTHFPVIFYASALYWAKDKGNKREQEIAELITEAQRLGIEVAPPLFHELRDHFGTPDGVQVTFGLADIKGLGDTVVHSMKQNIESAEDRLGPRLRWTWFEFLTGFSKTVGEANIRRMIEAGGLRLIDSRRQRLIQELEIWFKLTDVERAAINGLGDPIYEMELVTRPEVVEEPKYSPKAMKEYKAAYAAWEQSLVDPPDPDSLPDGEVANENPPPHPEPTGTKKVTKSLPVLDADGKKQYRVVEDAEGNPVVISPPTPCSNLIDALRALLDRIASYNQDGGVKRFYTKDRGAKLRDLISLLERPPAAVEDPPYWIEKVEMENLGVPLTASKVQSADRSQANCTVADYHAGFKPAGNPTIYMVVEIDNCNEREIATGKLAGQTMGRLVLRDETGTLETVVAFPDCWRDHGNKLRRKGSVLLVAGQRSWKEPKVDFIVEAAWYV